MNSKFKKILSGLLATVLSVTLVSCSNSTDDEGNDEGSADEISILMGKPEVSAEFEKMLAEYSEENDITVTMIPLAGQDAYEKMTTLYASGNPPSILMVGQEFSEFQENFLDLSDTDFVKKAQEGTLDFVTVDDKVYGTPSTLESYALMYNEDVIHEVLGEDVDPSSFETLDELEQLFDDLEANGQGAVTLSPMDWSLGAHFTNTIFSGQSETHEGRFEFIDELKAGNVNLSENDVYNGWADVFDLLIEHNIHKDSPLSVVYEDNSADLANGDAAVWFMGNWAYPDLKAINPDANFKFIPIPVSNDPADYANGKIAIGVPSYWCVDESGNTEAQQKAAVDFLDWFLTSERGQEYYVNELNFIPAYEGFTPKPEDSLSIQTFEMLDSGENLEWINTYYPAGGFQAMGASCQKYLDGIIDREGLAKEIEDYWKSEA